MDWILAALVSRAIRRGRAGDPLWLAVGAAAWMLRRTLKDNDKSRVAWSGRISPGERLQISVGDPGQPGMSATDGE
jgi:hypothetical protein